MLVSWACASSAGKRALREASWRAPRRQVYAAWKSQGDGNEESRYVLCRSEDVYMYKFYIWEAGIYGYYKRRHSFRGEELSVICGVHYLTPCLCIWRLLPT